MDADLKTFVRQWLRIAAMAIAPVVMTAFAAIPYSLGGHPGERQARTVHVDMHPT